MFPKNHRNKLREEVNALKDTSYCQICKKSYPAPVMDYHHIDKNNKINAVSQLILSSVSRKKVFDEIDKCILLCANCHRLKHAGLV